MYWALFLVLDTNPNPHHATLRCRFYAFQFHLEELVDSLEELQAATTTLVRVMPRHARTARAAAAASLYPQPPSGHP